jgi:hypothetical protein
MATRALSTKTCIFALPFGFAPRGLSSGRPGATPSAICGQPTSPALALALTDEQAADVGHDLGEDLVDSLLAIDFGN